MTTRALRNFAFHIRDDRLENPVIRRAKVRDEFGAQLLADRMLRETFHHQAVAVWEGRRRLCTLSSTQDPEHAFAAQTRSTRRDRA